jgi:hypothetical protein
LKMRWTAQFLPESGHLLADVVNKMWLLVKDPKGYGVPMPAEKSLTSKNESITTFQLNHLGIGNFVMIPSLGDRYRIVLTHRMKEFSFLLDQKNRTGWPYPGNSHSGKTSIYQCENQ